MAKQRLNHSRQLDVYGEQLRKTLDGLQCLEPGENQDCWYRAD